MELNGVEIFPEWGTPKPNGTRKIADLPRERTCTHPEHNPPTHCVFPDGIYEHVCPGCGASHNFTIQSPRMSL